MATAKKSDKGIRFTQLYRMPGEGLIAEFLEDEQTRLYDIEGLRYRVLKRRAAGLDTSEEDKALAIMSSID